MRLSTYALIIGAAILVLTAQTTARADFHADEELCDKWSPDVDGGIAACTRQIGSGRRQGRDLAISYNNRGSIYAEIGDLDRAIADYDQAIRLDPKYVNAYTNSGNAYKAKGDLDRAIADYDQAIRLDPKYARAYRNRASVNWDKKDFAAAIADYTKVIELDPNDASALYWRGRAKRMIGDNGEGDIDIAAAKRINPNIGD